MTLHSEITPAGWHGAKVNAGTLASRPVPSVIGQLYFVDSGTEEGSLFIALGTSSPDDWSLVVDTTAGTGLTVRTIDSTPTVTNASTLVFPNASLTDDGGGQITIDVGGGTPLTVSDVDIVTEVTDVERIVFPNGTVVDDGGNQVSILIPTSSRALWAAFASPFHLEDIFNGDGGVQWSNVNNAIQGYVDLQTKLPSGVINVGGFSVNSQALYLPAFPATYEVLLSYWFKNNSGTLDTGIGNSVVRWTVEGQNGSGVFASADQETAFYYGIVPSVNTASGESHRVTTAFYITVEAEEVEEARLEFYFDLTDIVSTPDPDLDLFFYLSVKQVG